MSMQKRNSKITRLPQSQPSLRRILLAALLLQTLPAFSSNVTWTGGPEDTFFCGYKWDDPDCKTRQHCPSGRNEDCEFHANDQKCFANSPCDAQYGDGSLYVPGNNSTAPKESPATPTTGRPTYTGISEDLTDHYWCGVGLDEAKTCVQHCASGQASECPQGMICFPDITACDARNLPPDTEYPTAQLTFAPTNTTPPVGGPTKIPTDMPIPPPEPLVFPSEDLTDHWFCGVGLDDANAKCSLHCPTAKECPMGQICYYGTNCDGRTYSPTPPPTHRPTKEPTPIPTLHPTLTTFPSSPPTLSNQPSVSPTLPMPTGSPTSSPSGRPTWAPLPALQLTFFCGSDWNDAIGACKKRCPTGEDTECPGGDFCFTGTSCTEELGYPEGFLDGGAAGNATGSGSGPQECIPFQVTVIADAWPNEISWQVNDTESNELVAEGGNDELVSGEPYDYPVECINYKPGCYSFTIIDSGGDGLCCDEGQGNYTVTYDGVELVTGGAFYDDEVTEFGLCGSTETPTKDPSMQSSSSTGNGTEPVGGDAVSAAGAAFRCVEVTLADRGYKISEDKCDLFDDCYNPQIKVGDDWFCDESSTCIEAVACGAAVDSKEGAAAAPSASTAESIPGASASNGTIMGKDDPSSGKSTPAPAVNSTVLDDDESSSAASTPAPATNSTVLDKDESSSAESTPAPAPATNSTALDQDELSSAESSSAPAVNSTALEKDELSTSSSSSEESTVASDESTATPALDPSPSPSLSKMSNTTKPKAEGGKRPAVQKPVPVSTTTTAIPTLLETTSSPTLGPCAGEPCSELDHCRSQYGFCGPGETYCNEKATWTEDCPSDTPASSQSPVPVSETPTILTSADDLEANDAPSSSQSPAPTFLTSDDAVDPYETPSSSQSSVPESEAPTILSSDDEFGVYTMSPTAKKWTKPGGGKGSVTRPVRTHSPTEGFSSAYPVFEQTTNPSLESLSSNPSSQANSSSPTFAETLNATSPIVAILTTPPSESIISTSPTELIFNSSSPTSTAADSTSPTQTIIDSTSSPSGSKSPSPTQTEKIKNDFTCTGERCPVDAHCRSRYGSCGPGFIYCNDYSTWDSTCPPPIPGVTPTRAPSPKPSSNTTTKISDGQPSFPPLAGPTLSTVSKAVPFSPEDSMGKGFIETDEIKTHEEPKEVVQSDVNESTGDSASEPSGPAQSQSEPAENVFESAEYFDSWAQTNNSCSIHAMSKLCIILVVITVTQF